MSWLKKRGLLKKNYKSLRICFKMRKFIFLPPFIFVHLRHETFFYEEDHLFIGHRDYARFLR